VSAQEEGDTVLTQDVPTRVETVIVVVPLGTNSVCANGAEPCIASGGTVFGLGGV
jgi:hypothetical protein